MSRPLSSAPRKYWLCHVGPIGIPVGLTTNVFLPPMLIGLSMFWLASVVWATSCAYTGASRHITTINTNTPPKNRAVLFRRNRRQASRHGPMPGGSSSPSTWSADVSAENSVPEADAVAIRDHMGRDSLPLPAHSHYYFSWNELQSHPYSGWNT